METLGPPRLTTDQLFDLVHVDGAGKCLFLALAGTDQIQEFGLIDQVTFHGDADALRANTKDHAMRFAESGDREEVFSILLTKKENKAMTNLRFKRIVKLIEIFKADQFLWAVDPKLDITPHLICYVCALELGFEAALSRHTSNHQPKALKKVEEQKKAEDLVDFENLIIEFAGSFLDRKVFVWI